MRVRGGHAIMLRVQLPDAIRQVAEDWVDARMGVRSLALEDPHITVVFVGRDLDEAKHDVILEVARSVDYLIPDKLVFQGRFSMFGGRRDHLVGLLLADDRLNFLRKAVCDRLREHGIVPERSFGCFTPHFTVAKGLPGDGGMSRIVDKEIINVVNMSVKLGSTLHMTIERSTNEEMVQA